MTTELEKRLLEQAQLPCCPFDRRSPDYYTTPNDQPCKVCGGLPEGPDRCTGADLRVMVEAATTIASLTAKLAEIDQERDRADNAQAYANEQFIRAEAAEAKSARLEAALKPFALPNGWHFIAYNKTGSTACPLNAGEVELARAALAGGGQATPGSGGTVDGGGCDL